MSRRRSPSDLTHAQLRDIVFSLHKSAPELSTASALVERILKQTPPLIRQKAQLLRLAEDILASS